MPTVTLPTGVSLERVAEIVRHAIRLGPGAWTDHGGGGGSPSNANIVRPVLPDDDAVLGLFTLLRERQIAYLLVGGIALLRYTEGRNTEDVDVVMSLPALRQLPEIQLEDQNEYFARGRFRGLQVDVLLTANPVFAEVQRRYATTHRFAELDVPTATPEGLILLKLYALPSLYRQGLFQRVSVYESDLANLIQRHQTDTAVLLKELQPHLEAGELRELSGIVEEIKERIARFARRRTGEG